MEKAETVDSPIGIWLIGFGFSVLSELLGKVGSNSTLGFSIPVSVAITLIVSTFAIVLSFAGSFWFVSTIE